MKILFAHGGSEYRLTKNRNKFLMKFFLWTPSPTLSPYNFLLRDTPAPLCSRRDFS